MELKFTQVLFLDFEEQKFEKEYDEGDPLSWYKLTSKELFESYLDLEFCSFLQPIDILEEEIFSTQSTQFF